MLKYRSTSIVLILLFIATSHVFTYSEAIVNGFSDIETYYFIAQNGFVDNAIANYPQHHLERWGINVIIGYIATTLNLDLWNVYKVGVILCLLMSMLLIQSLNWSVIQKITALALVIYNPYSFRLYYAAPGMISDCLFYTSILALVVGILNRSNLLIILAITISAIARQTSLILIPILILLHIFNHISLKLAMILSIEISIIFVVNKFITQHIYGESTGGYFVQHAFGLYFWIKECYITGSIVEPKVVFDFFARYLIFLIGLIPLILVIGKKYWYYSVFILSFFILHVQPIAGGPLLTSGNIQRLSAYGIPFLLPLLTAANFKIRYYIFLVVFVIMSLHHNYSILNYTSGKIYIFGTIVILGAATSLFMHKIIKT